MSVSTLESTVLIRNYRLLAEMTTHNHRVRQLLNRISTCVREYDTVQSNATATLGIPHNGLPRELLDAFGHDPAAVTGATRRFRGWKAVEDIHNRLVRQRDVFQAFLSCSGCDTPVAGSVLSDQVISLLRSVETLETHHRNIAARALDVCETLDAVQDMHTNVKTHYKATLTHTSVVYPEVSSTPLKSATVYSLHPSAFAYRSIGRKLQGPIPTFLGAWDGHPHLSLGYRHPILEDIWQTYWGGCPRLPHHTTVSQRIHWRGQTIPYSRVSNPLFAPLAWAWGVFLALNRDQYSPSPCCCFFCHLL